MSSTEQIERLSPTHLGYLQLKRTLSIIMGIIQLLLALASCAIIVIVRPDDSKELLLIVFAGILSAYICFHWSDGIKKRIASMTQPYEPLNATTAADRLARVDASIDHYTSKFVNDSAQTPDQTFDTLKRLKKEKDFLQDFLSEFS